MDSALHVDIERMAYPGADSLIENLRITALPGEICVVMGPTGSGKTTLLRIASGLERNYNGTVRFGQHPVLRPSRTVQYLPQEPLLFPWMSALDNVAIACADKAIAQRLMAETGLSSRTAAWPRDLSGGEQSRVSFCRALSVEPMCLLLDEPFHNVDVATASTLSRLLLQYVQNRGAACLLVAHNTVDAVMTAGRIVIVGNRPLRVLNEITVQHAYPRTLSGPLGALHSQLLAELAGISK